MGTTDQMWGHAEEYADAPTVADACMFVSIGETEPPPAEIPFLFFNIPGAGEMRSIGRYGNVATTVAAALGEGSGAPKLKNNATRFLIDTGSQSTCANDIGAFGVTRARTGHHR